MAAPNLVAPFIRNTIALKTHGWHEEAPSSSTPLIYPGMLLQRQSDDSVVPHAVAGGRGLRSFAKEDALQGHWFGDGYASGDIVLYFNAMPGDFVLAAVQAACPAITDGAFLYSAGDGTLTPTATPSGLADPLYENTAASAAVSNTTAETLFDKNYTVPANFFVAGDVIKIHAQGIVTGVNSTNTFNFKLKIGSTVIAATGAINPTANDEWQFECTLVVRTIGASGTFVASGLEALGTPGTVTALPFLKASTAIDTTATQQIGVSCTESAASSGNSARLDVLVISLERGSGTGASVLAISKEALDNSAGSYLKWVEVEIL